MKSASSTACSPAEEAGRVQLRLTVFGAVQGVGFRPFVYRLAAELGLAGWVQNSPAGVAIELEGARVVLDRFVGRLHAEAPAPAAIDRCEAEWGEFAGHHEGFAIRESATGGERRATILPDLATCLECRREIFDPANRRFRYPFTNCTHCGPRFSIIEALPYDRPNTAMKRFAMCPRCAAEYHDPADRRFHAQPNACPVCGPQLALWDSGGALLARRDDALRTAERHLREGAIVALKGIGGFQLLADARNEAAVRILRQRKQRPDKPFALMFPTLDAVRRVCVVPPAAAALLTAPEAPIVLLARRLSPADGGDGVTATADEAFERIAPSVAPNNPRFGVMLPYSPLHHLLLADLGGPVVATSGNLSDEPICIDEREAVRRLAGVADFYLVHDRPIVRPMDDSVARLLLGEEQVLRRARGYAPRPLHVAFELPPVLATGAQLKNTVALSAGNEVFVSQHIGDLDTLQARGAFLDAVADLPRLYAAVPELAACDLHPGYVPAAFARANFPSTCGVQHHYAHVLACMAERDVRPPVLGVCWDGTGYGTDGTIWGGEFLLVDERGFERAGSFRPFLLAGGDAAAREPRRSAAGVLHGLQHRPGAPRDGDATGWAFSRAELRVLRHMLQREVNTVATSSAGRLFDAVASLTALRQRATFEGQAAMELEHAIAPERHEPYAVALRGFRPFEFDWRPMIEAILEDVRHDVPVGLIAGRFHQTLVTLISAAAVRIGVKDVVLTGGCFQNGWLAEHAAARLAADGFTPHWPRQFPPNDGGLALGQVIAAAREPGARPAARSASAAPPVPGPDAIVSPARATAR